MYFIEVTDGPRKGDQIPLREGDRLTIGRQAHTQFPVSGDSTLSGTHCTVSVQQNVLSVTDEGSSNGTYVDGVRIQVQRLLHGQGFRAGCSQFVVRFYPSFGSWILPAIPPGWSELPGRGIRIVQTRRFPTHILFTEESHPPRMPLAEYIRRQQLVTREALPRAEFMVPIPLNVPSVEEAYLTRAQFEAAGGVLACQRELFVSKSGIPGIVSMTTINTECAHVDRMFDAVVAKARFLPRPPKR